MSKHNNRQPSPERNDLAKQVVNIIRQEYSGPLPPPQALAQYNDIIPNGAERIMAMAEQQSKHRQELEKKALDTDSRNSLLGIVCALIITLATLSAGVVVMYNGYVWQGTVFGSLGLVGLVSAFIYGTKQRRAEREAKSKAS